jgi:hypothetical protein
MSSLRYQQMTSSKFLQELQEQIKATPMDPVDKQRLLIKLEQYGPKVCPEVAKEFKQIRRKSNE